MNAIRPSTTSVFRWFRRFRCICLRNTFDCVHPASARFGTFRYFRNNPPHNACDDPNRSYNTRTFTPLRAFAATASMNSRPTASLPMMNDCRWMWCRASRIASSIFGNASSPVSSGVTRFPPSSGKLSDNAASGRSSSRAHASIGVVGAPPTDRQYASGTTSSVAASRAPSICTCRCTFRRQRSFGTRSTPNIAYSTVPATGSDHAINSHSNVESALRRCRSTCSTTAANNRKWTAAPTDSHGAPRNQSNHADPFIKGYYGPRPPQTQAPPVAVQRFSGSRFSGWQPIAPIPPTIPIPPSPPIFSRPQARHALGVDVAVLGSRFTVHGSTVGSRLHPSRHHHNQAPP